MIESIRDDYETYIRIDTEMYLADRVDPGRPRSFRIDVES